MYGKNRRFISKNIGFSWSRANLVEDLRKTLSGDDEGFLVCFPSGSEFLELVHIFQEIKCIVKS